MQRSEPHRFAGLYEFPGGTPDPGEDSMPGRTLFREISQETGFDPNTRFLDVVFFDKNDHALPFESMKNAVHMTYVYLGRVDSSPLRRSSEHSHHVWETISQVEKRENMTRRAKAYFNIFKPQLLSDIERWKELQTEVEGK